MTSDGSISGESQQTRAPEGPGDIERQVAESIQVAAHPQDVAVNLFEANGAVVLVAALPGVMAEDIEVLVEATTLRISAQARTLAPKAYLLHEWHYGPYERLVELPEGFEGDVSASFGNGQLAVRVGRGGRREGALAVQPAGYSDSPGPLLGE